MTNQQRLYLIYCEREADLQYALYFPNGRDLENIMAELVNVRAKKEALLRWEG